MNALLFYEEKKHHTGLSKFNLGENMKKQKTLERVSDLGILAVIRGPSPKLTIQVVEALIAGGIFGIEITYSTPQAALVTRTLFEKFGNMILLGMGTLSMSDQVGEAKEAGAQFIVSPHYDKELAHSMVESELCVMIGALTPSEIVRAYNCGADLVKLFPGSLGGPEYLRTLRGPLPHIPIMPTGGVDEDNIKEWFAYGAVAVGVGSNLCPTKLAEEGRFDIITKKAEQLVTVVNHARQLNGSKD
jgi:2-dehydro-3-deoxyphosphogluconate aldolase / (4S)-4-hydroxy-2-oxoglutarate aldolase